MAFLNKDSSNEFLSFTLVVKPIPPLRSLTSFAPTLEVNITIISFKSIVSTLLFVNLPSSNTCKNTLNTYSSAFSHSSNKITNCFILLYASNSTGLSL